MTNCEKAIETLQRTHDGDDLAPQHLRLVELAVNDIVTEVGQAAFEQLYNHIAGNTYVQPWYHDIENLRKDHRGYVYWKGIQVDHCVLPARLRKLGFLLGQEAANRGSAYLELAGDLGFADTLAV
jgi:hypothetical protein